MRIETLTDAHYDDALQVFVESLGARFHDETAGSMRRYWHDERTFVAVEDDVVLGVAAGFASRLSLAGGRLVDLAVVPSVGVRADAQRRGVGRALLEHQVREAAAAGAAAMALNASESAIYRRYGYGPTSAWWSIDVDPRTIAWRPGTPEPLDVTEHDLADGVPLARDLHDRAMGRWPGEVGRPESWWAAVRPRPSDKGRRRVAVHRGEDGEVDAHAIFWVQQGEDDHGLANTVEALDLVALDATAELRMWRWLLSLRLVGTVRRQRADPGSALPDALLEPRRVRTSALADAVWVRVLDVPAVLGRATLATGRVVLEVTDPLVGAVAGRWALRGDGDTIAVTTTDETPSLVVPTEQLAPLAFGFTTAARLAAAGRIDVSDPGGPAALDRLLAWPRASWCTTGF